MTENDKHQNTVEALRSMYEAVADHCRRIYPHRTYATWEDLTDNDKQIMEMFCYPQMTFMGVLGQMRASHLETEIPAATIVKQIVMDEFNEVMK